VSVWGPGLGLAQQNIIMRDARLKLQKKALVSRVVAGLLDVLTGELADGVIRLPK
jgi:hypothetical protein